MSREELLEMGGIECGELIEEEEAGGWETQRGEWKCENTPCSP